MALNLCLRVRDGMQSAELIGSSAAAGIPPTMPGAFYSNDGVTVTPIRSCAPADARSITAAIGMACRFHGARPADPLFTAPLPARVACGDGACVARDCVPFAPGTTARASTTSSCNRRRAASPSSGQGPGQDHRIAHAGGELGCARRCGDDGDVSLRRDIRRRRGYPHGSPAAVRNRAGFGRAASGMADRRRGHGVRSHMRTDLHRPDTAQSVSGGRGPCCGGGASAQPATPRLLPHQLIFPPATAPPI